MLLKKNGRDTGEQLVLDAPELKPNPAMARKPAAENGGRVELDIAEASGPPPLILRSDREPSPVSQAEKVEPDHQAAGDQRGDHAGLLRRHPIAVIIAIILLATAAAVGYVYWDHARRFESTDDAFIASRPFAVAPKVPGYITAVPVTDNQHVGAHDVIARIDDRDYRVALDQAQAQVAVAEANIQNIDAQITVQQAQVSASQGQVEQAQATLLFAQQQAARYEDLAQRGAGTVQNAQQSSSTLHQQEAALKSAQAAVTAAQRQIDSLKAQRGSAVASLAQANAQRDQAQSAIKAAEADVERLESILVDLVLVSPRSGRVQYRLARAGEVVAAGQRVLTILDLNDVYMTIYLPADDAGKLALGDEARIIVDPVPEYVIPATVSFVATEAQFTPKTVETAEERQKLMFHVKLQVDPKVLERYHRQVKTGVRGIGFVRTSPSIAWPDNLVVKLPQ